MILEITSVALPCSEPEFWFEVPCPHHGSNLSEPEPLPDYHPLTKDEIARLLLRQENLIKTPGFMPREFYAIICRFSQAIKGMTCPRPIDGTVSDKDTALNRLLVEIYEKIRGGVET